MKYLVIGSGGREHAIVRALSQEGCERIDVVPGNPGMAVEPQTQVHSHLSMKSEDVLKLAQAHKPSCIVVGPEAPLAAGLADDLRAHGFAVFGPSKQGAQLEASKIFAKDFMLAAGVPTAHAVAVSSVSEVHKAMSHFTAPYVLKADGLAAGKGVFICQTQDELLFYARQLFEDRILGEAGLRALLEQHQTGYELSYLVLTNGQDGIALPFVQDHKRLKDGDLGPNTGGMGTVAPLRVSAALVERIEAEILRPTLAELTKRNLFYRGVIFVGLMVTPKGPSVLEYNVRFGDPETQAVLPLLDGKWSEVLLEIARGKVPRLEWKEQSSVCIVLAAEGYPDRPKTQIPIEGQLQYQTQSSYFLHAGTALDSNGRVVVNGGRVLNAIGIAKTVSEAMVNANAQAGQVTWPGLQRRHDLGRNMP